MKITTIGLDIAKSVFHAVGVDKAGKLIKKKMLRRKDLLPFVAQIEPCLIVMEACSGAITGPENLSCWATASS